MLTHTDALSYIKRALDASESQSVPVAIVVVDVNGAPLASARAASAHAINLEAARKKAFTASVFKMTTEDFSTQISRDEKVQRALDKEPEMNLLPGGVLIKKDDQIVGALGVAGGFYMQDQAIADYAVSDE